jgi:hypothetical protein
MEEIAECAVDRSTPEEIRAFFEKRRGLPYQDQVD